MSKGEKIKRLLEEYNMSQTELAELLGVTKQTVFKYINGIITNIPSDKVEAMCKIFHCSPSYLMGWEEDLAAEDENPAPDEKLRELYEMYTHASPEIQKAVEMILRSAGSKP